MKAKSELELIAMIRQRADMAGRSPASRASHSSPSKKGPAKQIRGEQALGKQIPGKRMAGKRILMQGIGDDCALLRPRAGEDLAVTTDFTLERVHFRRGLHPAESVGHRCLARGLSDLAAMGARPEAAFLSLALPRSLSGRWMERFLDGLLALAGRYAVPLAGGDMAEVSDLVCADIVLLGSVPSGRALLRSGAQAGDRIYVSGALGGAAAELRSLERAPRRFARRKRAAANHPHLYPEPRLAIGCHLVENRSATAAIDLSDGLSTDLSHLCRESGLSAILDAAALPIAAGATLEDALHGGEDYELLFTAKPSQAIPDQVGGVPVRAIGVMGARPRRPGLTVKLRDQEGRLSPLLPRGWEHFRA